MITVLIVENVQGMQRQIKKTIQQVEDRLKILAADDIRSALKLAKMVPVDIFIININLPNSNELDFAKKLRGSYPNQPIIITSSEHDLAFQKLVHDEIENFTFLEKPYSWEQLKAKMKRALALVRNQTSQKLFIEQKKATFQFEINEIMYIETDKSRARMVAIVLYQQGNLVRKTIRDVTLTQILEALPGQNLLLRCHNSYIVNPQMIARWNHSPLQGYTIVLKYQDITIPIGKTFRNTLSIIV